MIRKTLIAAAAALPLALATPASAHGFNWGGFAAGAVVGGIVGSLARPYHYAPYYAPPVYVAPPPYVAPQVYYPSCTPPVHYDQHPPYCAPFGPSGYVIPPPDAMAFWIQASLNALMGARLEVDGEYGPATADAVAVFQTANRLWADGIAGSATLAVLRTQVAAAHLSPPPPPVAWKEPPPSPAPLPAWKEPPPPAPPVKAKG
jgi:hypothetical protein